MRRFRGLVAAVACVALATGCGSGSRPSLADGAASASESATTAGPTTTSPSARFAPLDLEGAPKVVVTPTGVVGPVIEARGDGWLIGTPCGEQAEVSQARTASAAHVVIDPGHGGKEVGAVAENGLTEAELNLNIAIQLERILEAEGLTVELTRYGDYRLPIPTRADIVNALKPQLFISIHHNGGAAARRTTPGTEVYYQQADANSRRLAGLVWEDVVAMLSQHQISWRGGDDAGAIYRADEDGSDFYGVLRRTAGVPAVLIEAAYLSSTAEADLLARPEIQTAEAQAIANGVLRYFLTADPGAGYMEPIPRGFESGGGGTFVNCEDPDLS
jgi:N-acetylmuramoyl-L-alanine amidase